MATDYVGGGFGRQMSRGKMAGPAPEKKHEPLPKHEEHKGHSRHATIRKKEDGSGYMLEHEHGTSEHPDFKSAAHAAGQAMGEQSVSEPENDDVPMENALGMVKDGMSGDD